jgi:hypothetical protein
MSRRVTRTWIAEPLADSLIAEYARRANGGEAGGWGRAAGVQDRGVAAAYDVEVEALLRAIPALEEAIRAAWGDNASGRLPPRARAGLVTLVDEKLCNGQTHARRSLEALLMVDGRASVSDDMSTSEAFPQAARGRTSRRSNTVRTQVLSASAKRVRLPLLLLNGIIAAVLLLGPGVSWLLGTPPPAGTWLPVLLSASTVWTLAFMPGWLFVRFLDRRAGALWDEYVINLHRLGLDEPANLPEPPVTSSYHVRWLVDGGVSRLRARNIYREKFDAYYGRSVSRFGADVERPVRPEALFPVFLCTALLAVGWTAALYDPGVSFGSSADPTVWTALSFGFAGAYVFFLETLLRRYYQADLRAGTYVGGYVRVVVALLVVLVLFAALGARTPGEVVAAVAFVVGWFPNAGMQFLMRVVARRLRGPVPSLEPAYPLNRLDGLNLWYETRLLEEGIEDLENLVTARLVDVLLHTRVPVDRLVDWVDQALLLVHLPAEPSVVEQSGLTHKARAQAAAKSGSQHPRAVLRASGVRSATSLLRALHTSRDAAEREDLLAHLETDHLTRSQVLTLHAVLAADPRLGAVLNWQSGDVKPRQPLPLAPVS